MPKRVSAPVPDKTRVLIILDCSNSMWDRWQSDAKIKVTQKVLLRFLDSIAGQNDIAVALRVFGHLNKNSYGTRLEVPFEEENNYKIQSKIKTLVPNGGCTAASALTCSLNDFPATGASRNIILIITDGMDDCDGNICDVARQVQLSGVIVQTFILGIGNQRDFQNSLDCAGKFTYLSEEEQYTESLYDIFRLSDQKAPVVFELQDAAHLLYETEVPLAFYDAQTHVVKYTTIYGIDSRYQPDTLWVDPLVDYDITLFTKPEITIKGRHFDPNVVNRIPVSVSQGTMLLRHEQRRMPWSLPVYQVLVRDHQTGRLLASQSMGERMDYLAGDYDVEVLSQPHIRLSHIEVRPGNTSEITLPLPGLLSLSKPKAIMTGSLFVLEDGDLDWVLDFNPNNVSERILLMPGEYQMVMQVQGNTDYQKVVTKRFRVESCQTTNMEINIP